jgi:hypothetical protein
MRRNFFSSFLINFEDALNGFLFNFGATPFYRKTLRIMTINIVDHQRYFDLCTVFFKTFPGMGNDRGIFEIIFSFFLLLYR